GILSEGLAAIAARVTGIDMSEDAIAAACGHNTFENLDYECVSTSRHADQRGANYDVLTCMELLEHVPDPKALVSDCQKLVKPGGHLFFSTINRNLASYVKLVLAGEYFLNMLPRGTHDYGRFIKPSELARWCRQCGLEIREISGMEYSPITRGYFLVEQPKTNYLIHAVKPEEHAP
ncbi:MAG: bifunctional 2-polyprenyl-6-hydroxyphenol methylase/3-demethylubiquinol 3-O-methyltransferase UbiG, partial [Gammaproteobacteria bacterium]|nr:bifunctional 2-polyprenyl-6-hydroxyphenol methylase/3-demethylubiquinol 3-O-methyltransferase UbiG [Gammaproteobacteria bacterium]